MIILIIWTKKLTPWSRVFLWGANSHSTSQGITHLSWFIIVFTRACHLSLSWATWNQFTLSHHIFFKFHFSVILLSVPRFSKWSLLSGLSDQSFIYIYILLNSHAFYMPCPSHPFEFITQIIFGEVYQLRKSSLCSLLQPHPISFLLDPILPSTLFSNTLNLFPSLSMRDQISHPYKTTGKIVALYIF
jgi:hypothetical protein